MPSVKQISVRTLAILSLLVVLFISMFLTNGLFITSQWVYGIFYPVQTAEDNTPAALDEAEREALKKALVTRSLKNMVPIQGGEFTMGAGDCDAFGQSGYCFFGPTYPVTLNDFAISKYKITQQDIVDWRKITHQPWQDFREKDLRIHPEGRDKQPLRPRAPAQIGWQEANAFCTWLGKASGKNIHLPTEAQWEFVARNRGQFVAFPTDNNRIEMGRNVPDISDDLQQALVGSFPPNPLGIYDLVGNGLEWMHDYYREDQPQQPSLVDPTGPASGYQSTGGVLRVTRPNDTGMSTKPGWLTSFIRSAHPEKTATRDVVMVNARCAIWPGEAK